MESVSVTQELIEKYRQINVDHNWWEFLEEDFTARMALKGIEVQQMYFSGFWSQGDGACFAGRLSNPLRFLRKHFPKDYPTARLVIKHGGDVNISCTHSGHYYHENCTSFSIGYDEPNNVMEQPTEFHEHVVQALTDKMDKEMECFAEQAEQVFKGYMRQLYRELEQEYEHLTSDEAVVETIIANDLHVTQGE
jgi:hypothetical protein